MSEVDLNIANYSLSDILQLFKIENGLDEEGMKKAKRHVLMMHPDKSNLSKEYFLFFSSAYKLLYKVYEFHKRNNEDATIKRNYSSVDIDDHQEHQELWKDLSNKNNFNEVFNELFNELSLTENKRDGYGEWFKEQEDILQATNLEEMNRFIADKKKNLSSIIIFNGINDIGGTAGSSLIDDEYASYQAGMFSSLPYDDLKHAYTETVVPVTEEEYEKRPKYSGVDHLQRTRQNELLETLSIANHHETLEDCRTKERLNDMERAYSLAKQDEEMQTQRTKITSKLLRIAH